MLASGSKTMKRAKRKRKSIGRKTVGRKRKPSSVTLRREIRTIKRSLKQLWRMYERYKSADQKAERALLRKLKTLQRSLLKGKE